MEIYEEDYMIWWCARGWISRSFLQFCFCKSQDLCVRDSRETFLWRVLVFTGHFWFLSLLPSH